MTDAVYILGTAALIAILLYIIARPL